MTSAAAQTTKYLFCKGWSNIAAKGSQVDVTAQMLRLSALSKMAFIVSYVMPPSPQRRRQ